MSSCISLWVRDATLLHRNLDRTGLIFGQQNILEKIKSEINVGI